MAIVPQATDVVVYGNIAEAALQQHSEAALVIYLIADALKRSPGDHGIPMHRLTDELVRLSVFRSRSHVREIIRREHGTFWHIGSGRVWLRSIEKLSVSLNARRANAHRHVISVGDLGTRAARRATLLAATLPIDRPIRQHTIRTHTGVSERAQRRYRRAGSFSATRQDADITTSAPAPSPWMKPIFAADHAEHGVYMCGSRVMKRIPNSYFPKGERLRRGRRSREMFAARPLNTVAEGTRTVPRIYFDRPVQWRRCRRMKFGTAAAAAVAYPFNYAYIKTGSRTWEAFVE